MYAFVTLNRSSCGTIRRLPGELERARDAQVEQRDGRQPLVAAIAQEHVWLERTRPPAQFAVQMVGKSRRVTE